MCLNCPAALYYNGGVLRGNILFMLRYVAALNASPPRLFASDLVKVMPCVLMADGKSIAPGLSDVVIQGQPALIGLKQGPVFAAQAAATLDDLNGDPSQKSSGFVKSAFVLMACGIDTDLRLPVAVHHVANRDAQPGDAYYKAITDTRRAVQRCLRCVEADQECVGYACSECYEQERVCAACALDGHNEISPLRRQCTACARASCQCVRMYFAVYVSDSASELASARQQLATTEQAEGPLCAISDAPHDVRNIRNSAFNWLLVFEQWRVGCFMLQQLHQRTEFQDVLSSVAVRLRDKMCTRLLAEQTAPQVTQYLQQAGVRVHMHVP